MRQGPYDLEDEGEPPRRSIHDEPLEFDSPMARILAEELVPKLVHDCELRTQAPIQTPWGNFYLDFLLSVHHRRIAIECDGDENFKSCFGKGEFQDALVLASEGLDVVYRLPGWLVWNKPHDALYVLSKVEPQFFTPRAKINLERLRTNPWTLDEECTEDPPEESLSIEESSSGFRFIYHSSGKHEAYGSLARTSLREADGRLSFVGRIANFARNHPGRTVEELEHLWRQR